MEPIDTSDDCNISSTSLDDYCLKRNHGPASIKASNFKRGRLKVLIPHLDPTLNHTKVADRKA